MSVKETDDQRERGNERGMKDKDRTGRKEREAERKSAKTCGREKKARDGEEGEKTDGKEKEREKRGILRETEGTRTLFWEKRDHFLFP